MSIELNTTLPSKQVTLCSSKTDCFSSKERNNSKRLKRSHCMDYDFTPHLDHCLDPHFTPRMTPHLVPHLIYNFNRSFTLNFCTTYSPFEERFVIEKKGIKDFRLIKYNRTVSRGFADAKKFRNISIIWSAIWKQGLKT